MALLMMATQLAEAVRGNAMDRPWLDRVESTGIRDLEWLPPAALRWIEMPPDDGAAVAWFMSRDTEWGDVVAWKSANGRTDVPARCDPVEAYQDWPARMGYWRGAAGDDRVARILHANYASWNAAMRQYVKIERMPPSSAFDRIRSENGDVIELTAALARALPGLAERPPLSRRRGLASPVSDAVIARGGTEAAGVPRPAMLSPHEQVRRLVVDYGPAISGFCRRWGKEVAGRA